MNKYLEAKLNMRNNGVKLTLEDWALAILDSDDPYEYWGAVMIVIDNNDVVIESVVTWVNGKRLGKSFILERNLPKWKLWVLRLLNL